MSGTGFLFQLRWLWNHIRQRLARCLLTIAGTAIAAAIFVGVSAFHAGYERALQRGVEKLGFELLVTAKGCPYEAASLFLRGGNIPMYIDASLTREVIDDPAVAQATRLFMQAVPTSDDRQEFVLGVDDSFLAMKPWLAIQSGHWFQDNTAEEAVLGYNVALELGQGPGDALKLGDFAESFQIAGVLERTGTQDDGTVFLPIATAQRLFDRKDQLTGLGIKLRDPASLPTYVQRVYDLPGVQVIQLSQAQAVLVDLAGTARKLMGAVGFLAMLIAALLLINTLSISLLERRKELAMLRALGAKGRLLFMQVFLESEALALLGTGMGIVLAWSASETIEAFLRARLPFLPRGPFLEMSWTAVGLIMALALAGGLICSLLPALQAASTKPFESTWNE